MKRLRPVGSTSRRPRVGEPAGTGGDAAAVERREHGVVLGFGARLTKRIVAIGRAAVDVQAVFHGKVFQIAQPGVDAPQRIVRRGSRFDARRAREPGALRGVDDQPAQPFAPPRIETIGLRVFIDQPFKLARIAGKPGGGEPRRQVPDGHGCDAPLGLRRFARIADDERIDHRQRSGDDFRKTFRGQRDGLSRQPFERAVCAHVHERVDTATCRSQSPNATSACRGGNAGS